MWAITVTTSFNSPGFLYDMDATMLFRPHPYILSHQLVQLQHLGQLLSQLPV